MIGVEMNLNRTRRPHQGFSLIELMVGMVIGMIAILIIAQMFINAESNKRTTTGGDDAQINGTIALYGLERDIQASGYGLTSFNLMGCSLSYTTVSGSTAVVLPSIAPVTINPATSLVPAGDANTDTVLVMYGNSDSPPEGDPLINASTVSGYSVATPSSFNLYDQIIAEPKTRPSPCALQLETVNAVSGSTLTPSIGNAGLPTNSPIYNLGQSPVIRAYAIRNGALTVCDYTAYNCGDASKTSNSSVWVPVANNIMSLRAEYGRDDSGTTAMSGTVTTYDQTTPGSAADTSGRPIYCGLARTLAVRLVIVARNETYDKHTLTTTAPTWTGDTVNTSTAPTNPVSYPIDLSANTNWGHYRYKTIETTIPLRNQIWQGSQTGC